jgi:hypothetical protein
MAQPVCFTCRAGSAGNGYGGTFSAYCAACQPRDSDPPLTGEACLCRGCGRVFTSVSAFDLHRRAGNDGARECLDPGDAGRPGGEPLFAAYRKLPDGTPVWGKYDARGRRPAPQDRSPAVSGDESQALVTAA